MHSELDPDALAAFRAHLARIHARETCHVCDVDNWAARWYISYHVFVMKVCRCCATVALFDAERIGIAPPNSRPALQTGQLFTTVVVDGQERKIRVIP